jgi:hypothetical protein
VEVGEAMAVGVGDGVLVDVGVGVLVGVGVFVGVRVSVRVGGRVMVIGVGMVVVANGPLQAVFASGATIAKAIVVNNTTSLSTATIGERETLKNPKRLLRLLSINWTSLLIRPSFVCYLIWSAPISGLSSRFSQSLHRQCTSTCCSEVEFH